MVDFKIFKNICLIPLFLIIFYFSLSFVYATSSCPGTWYCDNTPANTERECGEALGTYNGSFAGSSSYHYWNTTMAGPYVNISVSIKGEGNDDLDLWINDPTGEEKDKSDTYQSSDESVSTCSIAGTYRSAVYSFEISDDDCAPYNITVAALNQNCCEDVDCDDGKGCSLDTCSGGGCIHYTKENYNATSCGYDCVPGLNQCFDGICRATCPDFSISLDPISLTILRPLTGTTSSSSMVNITSINDFNSPTSLSGDWIGTIPNNVDFSYDPSSVTPPLNSSDYSDLTVTVDSTADLGTFTLRTYATAGSLTKTADLTVNIIEALFDFSVSVNPSSGSVVQGDQIDTTVNVTLLSGSTRWVSLSLSGCPPDTTCTLSSSGGYPDYTSTLTISTSSSTPNGTYTITITGVDGGLTRSDTYTLVVEPSPVCTRAKPVVSISPTYHYGYAGQTETYTVSVTNKDSTACGPSTFSLVGIVPSDFSYSFSQSTLVIKPVGFANTNTSSFYVTSNCTSNEGYHTIRVNVTNTDVPEYFSTASAEYYVYSHFWLGWGFPGSSQSGVSGSPLAYRPYVRNNKWRTCAPITFSLSGSVPSGWSYVLPSTITVDAQASYYFWFNVTSPCSAAPRSYTIQVSARDTSTGDSRATSGTYEVLTPYCYIRSTPFFDFGPFDTTLTTTFYKLNTTCFPTATLDCGDGFITNVPISGNQASTTCSYPTVAEITYYTTGANISANSDVNCRTTVVDNPDVFNFTVSVTPEPDYNGLVGFWSFDEGWGISTTDRSGNTNDGTLGVTKWEYVPTWTLGKFGYGLNFDGIDDYVEITNVPVDTSSGAYNTVAFWMYWNGGNSQMPIGWNTAYDLWLYGGCFGFNTGQGNILGIPWEGLADDWHHVVAIFYNGVPSSTTVSLYIDGVKQNIYECIGSTTVSRSVTPTVIISGWDTSSIYKFGGIIDEVKIFNRALSEEEILREYQQSKVIQGEETFALVPVTLLSGNTQPVSLSLDISPSEPSISLSLDQISGNPTYVSTLNISTSPLTPNGTYTITITGTNGTLTRKMNYTIEVLSFCSRSDPLIEISPVSRSGSAGSELSYSVKVKNSDGLECSANTFSLTLNPDFDATGWKFDRVDWLSGWRYREMITIDNTQNSNTLTDYQILVTVDTASLISIGKMNSDCSDIRFTDSDGSLINYWLESGCNSNNTRIWVKVPSLSASRTETLPLYYGNISPVSDLSNANTTFLFFDDFEHMNLGDDPDPEKWWTEGTDADDYISVTTDPAGGNNKVLQIHETGLPAGAEVATKVHTKGWPASGNISIRLNWRRSGGFVSWRRYMTGNIVNSTGGGVVSLATEYEDNYRQYYDPDAKAWTNYNPIVSTSANTWYTEEHRLNDTYVMWWSGDNKEHVGKYRFGYGSWAEAVNFTPVQYNKKEQNRDTYIDNVTVRKFTSPEPIIKIGITLNPQESKIIILNVTSNSTASQGTYTFSVNAFSGTYSNSTSGNYIVSEVCGPTQCETGSDPPCIDDGTCWEGNQVCYNRNLVDSCGDGRCNCGEDETSCSEDCAGVYWKLHEGWNLISLPYKSVVEVIEDTCGEDKLYFYSWENKIWKKVLGIKNIKGGYGYWVNPKWFTKVFPCAINVTVNKAEGITVQDIPELKKGYNAIGAPNSTKIISSLGCEIPIALYWKAYTRPPQWESATQLDPTIGYWVYVDEDCKLSV